MFHYVEYSFHGARMHTRRSGPLNDLEGSGLINEVKRRGGHILLHKEGTKEQIAEYIDYRKQSLADAQEFAKRKLNKKVNIRN